MVKWQVGEQKKGKYGEGTEYISFLFIFLIFFLWRESEVLTTKIVFESTGS